MAIPYESEATIVARNMPLQNGLTTSPIGDYIARV
jgi:hypothetical protein